MTMPATDTAVPRQRRTFGVPWAWRHNHGNPVLKAVHDDRTSGERVADAVAKFGGSWPFIFTFLGLIACWILVNTVVLSHVGSHSEFDPYPYIALNLALSALAGIQAPVILMSQNRASARDEALAADHYHEGKKTEALIEATQHLIQQNTDITQKIHELSVEIRQLVASQD
jgi:uncharacterized membrane protein